ncbi:MAG TPA: hypothetical protein PLR90_06475 [Methylophilus sp.]|nr:hypothetical protein [Methylophilus sp.]HQQ33546.1 hypothetical protein [Methylophilus sp.]
MGGLAVLFLLGFYFALTVWAVVKAKPLWVKGLVLLAAILIPTADAVYGRYKLKQMCAAEAGLKVYKVAHNVEGFMADTAGEDWITKYGYQFSEGERSKGKYYRISKLNDQIFTEENIMPKSKYRLRLERNDDRGTYRRSQYLIEDIATSELLATDTLIGFSGGWAERLIAVFSDGGINRIWCANAEQSPLKRVDNLVSTTLKNHKESLKGSTKGVTKGATKGVSFN